MARLSTAAGERLSVGSTSARRPARVVSPGRPRVTFAIIREELPLARVPGAIALLSSLMSVGFGAGIALTGPILAAFGLHFVFLLPMVGAVLAALAALLLVPGHWEAAGQHAGVRSRADCSATSSPRGTARAGAGAAA